MAKKTALKTYRAWLEVEIGAEPKYFKLPLPERSTLFQQRINAALVALEHASPGITVALTVPFRDRPFAFEGNLTQEQIQAIWPLPEVRFLADRDANNFPDPAPDKNGMLPFIVLVQQHHQEEGKHLVEVHRLTLLVRSKKAKQAMAHALEQCRTMPAFIMAKGFRLTKRWWTAERAYLNTLREEERNMIGSAMQIDVGDARKERAASPWHPKGRIANVAFGSPKQRPETWEWMIEAP